MRANAPRLVRRYAAEAKAGAYAACVRLLEAAPCAERHALFAGLAQGLSEQSAEHAEPVSPGLKKAIATAWRVSPSAPLYLELALAAGIESAQRYLLSIIADQAAGQEELIATLGLLARFGSADSTPAALERIDPKQPAAVAHAAIAAANRFENAQVTEHLLSIYPQLPAAVRSDARDALLSRPGSALALLRQVESGKVDPQEFPLDQLRRAALHGDEADRRPGAQAMGRYSTGHARSQAGRRPPLFQ